MFCQCKSSKYKEHVNKKPVCNISINIPITCGAATTTHPCRRCSPSFPELGSASASMDLIKNIQAKKELRDLLESKFYGSEKNCNAILKCNSGRPEEYFQNDKSMYSSRTFKPCGNTVSNKEIQRCACTANEISQTSTKIPFGLETTVKSLERCKNCDKQAFLKEICCYRFIKPKDIEESLKHPQDINFLENQNKYYTRFTPLLVNSKINYQENNQEKQNDIVCKNDILVTNKGEDLYQPIFVNTSPGMNVMMKKKEPRNKEPVQPITARASPFRNATMNRDYVRNEFPIQSSAPFVWPGIGTAVDRIWARKGGLVQSTTGHAKPDTSAGVIRDFVGNELLVQCAKRITRAWPNKATPLDRVYVWAAEPIDSASTRASPSIAAAMKRDYQRLGVPVQSATLDKSPEKSSAIDKNYVSDEKLKTLLGPQSSATISTDKKEISRKETQPIIAHASPGTSSLKIKDQVRKEVSVQSTVARPSSGTSSPNIIDQDRKCETALPTVSCPCFGIYPPEVRDEVRKKTAVPEPSITRPSSPKNKDKVGMDIQVQPARPGPSIGLMKDSNDEIRDRKDTVESKIQVVKENLQVIEGEKINIPEKLVNALILTFGGWCPEVQLPYCTATGKLIYAYFPKSDRWLSVGEMPVSRSYHTAIFLNDEIYIIGGYDHSRCKETDKIVVTGSVVSYKLNELKWHQCASLQMPRASHNSVEFDGVIYTLGGEDEMERILKSMEKYDPSNKRWIEVTEMLYPITDATSCASDVHIIVIGGLTSNSSKSHFVSSIMLYNPKTDSWTTLPYSLPYPLAYGSCAINSNCLCIIGGQTIRNEKENPGTVFVLDSERKEWIEYNNLPVPRIFHTCVSIGSQIFIIGGLNADEGNSLDTVEALQIFEEQTKTQLQPLPTALAGMAAVILYPMD